MSEQNLQKKVRAKKKYGQNFLIDRNILQKIVSAAELGPGDKVLEIGTGTGNLTEVLAEQGVPVHTCEIDAELLALAKHKLEKFNNITFSSGDFLKNSEVIFSGLSAPVKVVANIPYYITTPILENLFKFNEKIKTIIVMIQKEVADRIKAEPGRKDYGSLTLFVKYFTTVEKICDVPPAAFQPRPEVTSSVLKLSLIKNKNYQVDSEKRLFKIIHAAFWGRRKTLANCLKMAPYTHYTKQLLTKMEQETGLDLRRRGETLSLEEFVRLANVKI